MYQAFNSIFNVNLVLTTCKINDNKINHRKVIPLSTNNHHHHYFFKIKIKDDYLNIKCG